MSAYRAAQALSKNEDAFARSTERLSSGYKINQAKDNPSGIAISRKMRSQIKGLELASDNAADGVNVVETAEGALNEVHDMLKRINELAIKSANGTMSDADRANIEMEVKQLKDEINRVSETTEFNGINLLDGSAGNKAYTDLAGVSVLDHSEEVKSGYYQVELTVGEKMIEDENGNLVSSGEYEIMTPGYDVSDPAVRTPQEFELELPSNDSTNKYTHKQTGEKIDYQTVDNPVFNVADNKYDIQIKGDNSFDLTLTFDLERMLENEKGNANVTGQTNPDDGSLIFTITAYDKDEFDNIQYQEDIDNPDNTLSDEEKHIKTEDIQYKLYKVKVDVEIKGYGGMTLQIGAEEGQTLEMNLSAVNTKTLQIDNASCATYEDSVKAIKYSSDAIDKLSLYRARLGAYENRLNHAISSLDTTSENMTKAYSTITDTDMAQEMTDYTNYQVLVQAGTSMVAQANERPSQVLQLLQ